MGRMKALGWMDSHNVTCKHSRSPVWNSVFCEEELFDKFVANWYKIFGINGKSLDVLVFLKVRQRTKE